MHQRTTRRTVAGALAAATAAATSLLTQIAAPTSADARGRRRRRKVLPVTARFHFADIDLRPHGNGLDGHHEMTGSGDEDRVVVTRNGVERTMTLAGYERAFRGYTAGYPLVTLDDRQFRLHGHVHHRPTGAVTFHLVEEAAPAPDVAGQDTTLNTCCCSAIGDRIIDGQYGYRCCHAPGKNDWCVKDGTSC